MECQLCRAATPLEFLATSAVAGLIAADLARSLPCGAYGQPVADWLLAPIEKQAEHRQRQALDHPVPLLWSDALPLGILRADGKHQNVTEKRGELPGWSRSR